MSRTIRGKSISDILLQIAEYKSPTKKLVGKYPYYPISDYYERMNNVLGIDHYTIEYSDHNFLTVNSGQEMVSCKCRITLLDDDYVPFLYKEGYGGREILYANETGLDSLLKNLDQNAAHKAFKAACKQFSIFGAGFSDSDSSEYSEKPNAKNTRSSSSTLASQGKIFELSTLGAAESIRKDVNTGLFVYKLQAKLVTDGKRCDVVFYPNQYKKDSDKFNRMLRSVSEAKLRLKIIADEKPEIGGVPQLIFKSFSEQNGGNVS